MWGAQSDEMICDVDYENTSDAMDLTEVIAVAVGSFSLLYAGAEVVLDKA